ncbi:VOC family protein [Oceanimonas sp. CHS3-5]|uniref:VOC family protein n=1 Tax=Oceanimonas sp. CHS3-5 TaxID=3068186 RepID=UPI00273CFA5D|nr:VOC family protein [Oceanimonas sp. CHS3-5]MDP5291275.1 VOC family protein [Oceanimonas sp. CHS3-5]
MVSPITALLGDTDAFFNHLADAMTGHGLTARLGSMDHICYRADSNDEYRALKTRLAEHGQMLVEGMIGGRPIITYALNKPLPSPFGPVPCLELAAPKPGKTHHTGLEHGEIVVPSLTALLARYPDVPFNQKGMPKELTLTLPPLQIKFHCQSLADTIADEIAEGLVVPVPENYFR